MDSKATTSKRGLSARRVTSLLVSTSHPSAVTTAVASGALTLICPRSGTIQNSTRIQGGDLQGSSSSKGQVGVSHISIFPHRNAEPTASSLAIAYGSSTNKKRGNDADDSYGMLFTIRRASTAAPILHWKCRLPEPNMTGGLLVSPVTSQHIVGGGSSGTLYVWDALQGGSLARTVPAAHYRAITCMQWSAVDTNVTTSPWDCHLVTGGADGMVHAFSHLDLVERPSSSSNSSSIQPIRTWTKHHLAVTALTAMNGGRMASAAEDGQVVVMELCSGATLAVIQLPDAIRALTTDCHHGRRLFAGSVKGTVHIVDLDSYALHRTVQMGATIVHIPKYQKQQTISLEDRVFGSTPGAVTANSDDSSPSYQEELRGHDRAITCLAVFNEENESGSTECLVSGDESGVLRVWDSRRGCCVRVVNPWSHSALVENAGDSKSKLAATTQLHPVTSISVIREEVDPFDTSPAGDDTAMFGTRSSDKRARSHNSFGSMVSPLQKFSTALDDRSSSAFPVAVPFLEPRRDDPSGFWDLSTGRVAFEKALQARQKRWRRSQPDSGRGDGISAVDNGNELQQQRDEIAKLKKELEEAKTTIERWEIVNNKLISKIQGESSQL
jgi:WD40 repeat protein